MSAKLFRSCFGYLLLMEQIMRRRKNLNQICVNTDKFKLDSTVSSISVSHYKFSLPPSPPKPPQKCRLCVSAARRFLDSIAPMHKWEEGRKGKFAGQFKGGSLGGSHLLLKRQAVQRILAKFISGIHHIPSTTVAPSPVVLWWRIISLLRLLNWISLSCIVQKCRTVCQN